MRLIPSSLLAAACLLAGCAEVPLAEEPLPYAPRNFTGEPRLPANLRRVVLLPVAATGPAAGESLERLDGQLLLALQRAQRFEVVPLRRADCRRRYGVDAFASTAALPPGLLEQLGREYAAEAVMFVDLTALQSYPPLALGLRAKLATIGDVRLVWSFDEVVAADDPAVGVAVRRRFAAPAKPGESGVGVLQSPVRFGGFAAEAMFATLPPR